MPFSDAEILESFVEHTAEHPAAEDREILVARYSEHEALAKREAARLAWNGRREVDWSRQPLGQKSDRALAAELGVDRTAVAQARRRRGIAACTDSSRFRENPRKVNWVAVAGLGRMPDGVLARKLGVTRSAVIKARMRLGVPAYRPGQEAS